MGCNNAPFTTPTFFFFFGWAPSGLVCDVWLFPNSGSSSKSAARDVINFIHTLWMFCLEKKKERKREKREDGDGVAEGDFQFQRSCMYNE